MSLVTYTGKKRGRSASMILDPSQTTSTNKVRIFPKRGTNNYRNRNDYVIVRGPNIVPDSISTKLVYSWTAGITGSSGAKGVQQFRGNSCYDPDFTGTGTQPVGFDELMALYARFRVTGSKITVRATKALQTETDDLVVLPTALSTLVGTDLDTLAEQPFAKRKVGKFGIITPVISSYMSTGAMYGLSKQAVRAEKDFTGTSGSDPSLPWYWTVAYQSIDRSSTQAIYAAVTIEYYVTFFERLILSQS